MKKSAFLLLFTTILGLGTGSLASCSSGKPENKPTPDTETEGNKDSETETEGNENNQPGEGGTCQEIYLYSVILENSDDVTLETEKTNYKKGDIVKVKTTLKTNKYEVLGITVTGGVRAQKVEGEANTFSFEMPEKAVFVKPILKSKEFKITFTQDETKGHLSAHTANDNIVSKAKAGTELVLYYEAKDLLYMPKMIKANEEELLYDENLLGYPFFMPASDVNITITYQDALYQIYNNSSFAFTKLDYAYDDTSLIYSLKTDKGLISETLPGGTNTFEKIVPGTEITIVSSDDTSKLKKPKKLEHVYIDDTEVTFKEVDTSAKYEFDPFIMPGNDAVLRFEFDKTEFVPITYDVPDGVDVISYNPMSGEKITNPLELAKGSMIKFSFKPSKEIKLDLANSGIFESLSNKKVGSFMLSGGEYSTVIRDVTKQLRIQIKGQNSLAGTYLASKGIRPTDPLNTTLTISDYLDYSLVLNDDYSKKVEGFLSYENGQYVSDDSNLKITQVFNKTSNTSMLLATYKDTDASKTYYFVFGYEAFATTLTYTSYKEGIIAQIQNKKDETTIFAHFKESGASVVTLNNFDTSFKTETDYELVEGEVKTILIYDGEKLVDKPVVSK